MTDAEIGNELCKLAVADQLERQPNGTMSFENDVTRARRLNEIIEQVGWPTLSRFGEPVVQSAWLIAQHCVMGLNPDDDHSFDLSFQKYVMQLMRPLRRRDEVPARHYVYLLDRTRNLDGKTQPYGTQYKPMGDGTSAQLAPVWHSQSLDRRRATIGMEPALATLDI